MYICGVNYESIADGIGVRTTIFVSGCLHNCVGCHSPETHNFTYGSPMTEPLITEINSEISKRPFLSGITISGGDAMYSPLETVKLIKQLSIPKNNIWLYTGFTIEEILNNNNQMSLLKHINVLVDGRFEYTKRDITLKWRGSSNQRVIDVSKTLKTGNITLYDV